MALLARTLALLAMTVATVAIKVVPLDMAQDSFDDQYQGCGPAMTAALPALNCSEFQKNPLFAQAWVKATAEWQSQGSLVSPLSSPAQAIALMAYTMEDVYEKCPNKKCLYEKFNGDVRAAGRSRQEYRDNFHFKTLHFLLTQALVTLRDIWGPQCHDVYWGVRGVRFKAEQGDIVRFGQFTSVSLNGTTAKDFGIDTVFQVHTCHGVDIWEFSNYPNENEVLIPPFETFEVIEVSQEGGRARIQLHSTGAFSNYNCEWLRGGSVPRAPFQLGGLLLATTALAMATGVF
ncbi:erythroblast NAD(P)(+)--arginine ADP-ribosyltransferase-like [Haemorhous mexicanus]|uniref:erythroblast NAD(P)(+)--arginine ADP-ribosyltransferase-like n=1 Tax=Haemorhous mexicanus TaxID=30427 RepID=UPI0028BE4A43|nr:erythroblast NAD(P)(+)--arginine ADP-ribosyltransferase-like [Haemorhous mexicanus]